MKVASRADGRASFYASRNCANLCHRATPVGEQSIARQMRHAQIDFQLETSYVGNIGRSACRRENTVIKQNVSVEIAGENHTGHHQIGAHETYTVVACSQAVRELLRQHDQRSSVAAPRYVQTAADAQHSQVARGYQFFRDGYRKNGLPSEVEVGPAEYRHDVGTRAGR